MVAVTMWLELACNDLVFVLIPELREQFQAPVKPQANRSQAEQTGRRSITGLDEEDDPAPANGSDPLLQAP
jgi:hypothetical protein